MKRKAVAATSLASFLAVMLGAVQPAMNLRLAGIREMQGTAAAPVIRFVAGSSVTLEQLLGSANEAEAKPIVQNGTLGDLSVTWCKDLGLWLMTYDRRAPTRGIAFSYSRTPWGPWSEPQILFNAANDGIGRFIHNPNSSPPDGLAGPVIGKGQLDPEAVRGGAYARYVVERWTKLKGSELSVYYVLSTWNPYVVVLMKSRLKVE